ncbi:MAG TPA: hypothetical protein VJB60_02070 [Candidatus Peribacterales bacterium]|nr:hypothetical protein [Candidatus Peribacterales bacterium]
MALRLRERFGLPAVFLLILIFTYWYVSNELYAVPVLELFSPLGLISIFPFGGNLAELIQGGLSTTGVMWLQGVLVFLFWSFLFMCFRGLYYSIRNWGDVSMWHIFAFALVLAVGLFYLLVIPVLRQIDLWKAVW